MSHNFDPDDEWTPTNPYQGEAVPSESPPTAGRAARCSCARVRRLPESASGPARAPHRAAPAAEPPPVQHLTYEEFLVWIPRIPRRFPEVYRTVAGEPRNTWPKPVLLATGPPSHQATRSRSPKKPGSGGARKTSGLIRKQFLTLMSSEKRIEASRANGAKSHGPKTPEGKANSSRNSLKHGLRAASPAFSSESQERYELMLHSYMAEFQPRTDGETALVEELAVLQWRRRRIWDTERSLVNMQLNLDAEKLGRQFKKLDNDTRTALAMLNLEKESHGVTLCLRYAAQARREHQRALQELYASKRRDIANLPNEPRCSLESAEVAPEQPEKDPERPQNGPNTRPPLQASQE